MAYPRPDPTTFAMEHDDRIYMNSPMHRAADAFPGPKGPDPLSGSWNYDSAIDLFSLNTSMLSDPFPLEMPNEIMGVDPKEFPADFFAPPPDISGFAISNHSGEDAGSVSSDLESDDQSWSPSYVPSTDMNSTSGQASSRRKTIPTSQQKPQAAPHRWSSSPELMPQDYAVKVESPMQPVSPLLPTPTSAANRKMTRSMSGDSNASTGPTTSTTSGRNAAKRAAHNIIEKRYRTNMNAKFVALEKAMCGGVQKQTKGGSASLKKSEILSNAIGYMHELQEENKALHKELALLKQNLLPAGTVWRPRE